MTWLRNTKVYITHNDNRLMSYCFGYDGFQQINNVQSAWHVRL